MRGIIVNAEGEKVIIAATPSDIARFSKKAEVVVAKSEEGFVSMSEARHSILLDLSDEGYYLAKKIHGLPPLRHMSGEIPKHCIMRLRTLCGAEQTRIEAWPPKPFFQISVARPSHQWFFDNNSNQMTGWTLREFRMTKRINEIEFLYEEQ